MLKKGIGICLAALGMAMLLSGCFFQSMDELYALPKQSEEYYALQSEIDRLLTNGAAYAAPTSGTISSPFSWLTWTAIRKTKRLYSSARPGKSR